MTDKEVFGPLEGEDSREPSGNRKKEPKETSNVSHEREEVENTARAQDGVQTHLKVELQSGLKVIDARIRAWTV